MEKNFSEQDSFRLINEMIVQARSNFQKGSANSSIFSGYFVAATAAINFALIYILDNLNQSFWVWLLMIPMTIISSFIDSKRNKGSIVKTHIDTIIAKTWAAFAISVVMLLLPILGTVFAFKSSFFAILITPIILIMMGAAQYTTSVACRFKPYYYGAIVFWVGALACVVSYLTKESQWQFIILAVCAVLGLCVPGHILNRKAE